MSNKLIGLLQDASKMRSNISAGPMGPPPAHEWDGTRLRFENPDGSMGDYVDLMPEDAVHQDQFNQHQLSTQKRLSSLEQRATAIEGMNVNAEERVTITSNGTVTHLPKNAANGQISVASIKGKTIGDILSKNINDWEIGSIASHNGLNTASDTRLRIKDFISLESNFNQITTKISTGFGFILFFYQVNNTYISNTGWLTGTVITALPPLTSKTRIIIRKTNDSAITLDELTLANPQIYHGNDTSTKSTISASVKSVGRNLFDKSIYSTDIFTGNASTPFVIDGLFKAETAYTLTVRYKKNDSANTRRSIFYTDGTSETTSFSASTFITHSVTTNPSKTLLRVIYDVDSTIQTMSIDLSSTQLELGTTATPYTPYTETQQFFPAIKLASVPSAKDEIRPTADGGYEEVRRTGKVILTGSANWTLSQTADITYRFSISGWSTANNAKMVVNPNSHFTEFNRDSPYEKSNSAGTDTRLLAIHGTDTNLYLRVEKTKVDAMAGATTLDKFKNYLNQFPITLTYQLASPIVTPISTIGNAIAHPGGTIYYLPRHGDTYIYGDGIVVEGVKFEKIHRVTKVDLVNGTETDITDSCQLNAEANGFTSPELAPTDIVWYELDMDPSTTTIPEQEYTFFDSRYVVIDDVDGKVRRWKVTSANGVPQIELVEV